MEWIADPTAWLGLGTLILLEIVLGVDNLIFIAILVDKLPPSLRNRARIVGLSLALLMRVAMLAGVASLKSLTAPVLTLFGSGLSVRDLILIGGGLFLLLKATTELHARLEVGNGGRIDSEAPKPAVFWQVIVQIVIIDFVFSIDSVVTAVGMVDHLSIMVIAVAARHCGDDVRERTAYGICKLPPNGGDPCPRLPVDDWLQPVRGRLGIQDPKGLPLRGDCFLRHDRNAESDRNTQPTEAGGGGGPTISDGRSSSAHSGEHLKPKLS